MYAHIYVHIYTHICTSYTCLIHIIRALSASASNARQRSSPLAAFFFYYSSIHTCCVNRCRDGPLTRGCSRQGLSLYNEQALVCLYNREMVDASRGRTFHCKMANNRFVLYWCWPNLFSHLAAFNSNRRSPPDPRVDGFLYF